MRTIDHRYLECGLDNVVISGVEIVVDEDGDEAVRILAVNDLHRVIAEGIVAHRNAMSGAELRFLRSEMGLTQTELAGLVHRDKQSIGRWERGEIEIDRTAEALIRRLAIEKLRLGTEVGIDELSRRSLPGTEPQPIRIVRLPDDERPYRLAAA